MVRFAGLGKKGITCSTKTPPGWLPGGVIYANCSKSVQGYGDQASGRGDLLNGRRQLAFVAREHDFILVQVDQDGVSVFKITR